MARHRRVFDDGEDAPHHPVGDQPNNIFAAWIVAILLLITGALLLNPGRVLERDPEPAAVPALESVSGTGDVLMDDHTFAPRTIAVHPNDRLVFRNSGKDLQALTVVDHDDVLKEALVEPGASVTFVIPPTHTA
jgi:hypothetical protein